MCSFKSTLSAMCEQGGRTGEAPAREGLSSLEKSLLFQSQSFSMDEVNNPVNIAHTQCEACQNTELLSNYDLFFSGLPGFSCVGPSAQLERRDWPTH